MIILRQGDKEYRLRFTKKTISKLENSGFKIGDISNFSMTLMPMFFHGAFAAEHPGLPQAATDKMLEKIVNKPGMWEALAEDYSLQMSCLMVDPEESEGNLTWAKDE